MKAIVIREEILHRIVLRYARPAGINRGLHVTRCRLERHSGHDATVNKQYYKCHPARDLITIRNRRNCFSELFINIAVICTCDLGGLLNADMSGGIPFSVTARLLTLVKPAET